MANITIGQYLPFDSFIHKLDPRVKIVGVFLYIITIFFVKDFLTYIPFIVLLIVVLSVAKIPLKAILRSLKPLIFIQHQVKKFLQFGNFLLQKKDFIELLLQYLD